MYIYLYTFWLCTVGSVSALDDIVGETIKSLKDAGMYNNSVIVFTSDVSPTQTSDNEQYLHHRVYFNYYCITAANLIAWGLKANKSYLIK